MCAAVMVIRRISPENMPLLLQAPKERFVSSVSRPNLWIHLTCSKTD